jgi:D-psicose/D-tagatose/L-ribulose 3-epimerase
MTISQVHGQTRYAMKPSFLFHEPIESLSALDERMRVVAGCGYAGIELSARHPMPYTAGQVAELAGQHNLDVVSILSGWSYAHERLCLSSRDADVRRRAVARLQEYAAYCGELGCVLVVGLMQGLRSDEPDAALASERIVEGLRAVAAAAHDAGISAVLEPVNHMQVGFHNTADEAADVVARVGSRALGIMLDTLHMNVEERSVLEAIRRHGAQARHFHLCDTNGGPFGTGGLDFAAVLSTLASSGYAGCASVKVYRNACWEDAALHSARFLRDLGYFDWSSDDNERRR